MLITPAGGFVCVSSDNLSWSWEGTLSCPSTGEDTEAQSGQVLCLGSPSQEARAQSSSPCLAD